MVLNQPGRKVLVLVATLLLLLPPLLTSHPSRAFQESGQFSSLVIGQSSFVSSTATASQNHLFSPQRVAFDQSGNLWVSDENNYRVLEFKPPFSDGEPASLVIGQSNFKSHTGGTSQNKFFKAVGIAFDTSNDLWVVDNGNNRVLEFKPPFTDGMNASLELGQPAGPQRFTTNSSSSGASRFDAPIELKFDGTGDIWVSDNFNDRVLEFKPPFTDGMSASVVIGQPNMTATASTLLSPSSSDFNSPSGIAFDSRGNLWVADYGFNRLLEFAASSLGSDNPSAILELGQAAGPSQFTWAAAATTRGGLMNPNDLAFDPAGDLWVSDRANNRILGFNQPFSDGANASWAIGHLGGLQSFKDNSTGLTQATLWNPLGIAFDQFGNLWLADQRNNRVLEFSGATSVAIGTNVDVPTTTAQTVMNVSSVGNACYRMGLQTICHVTANQESATGVRTEVVGVASASTVNIYSSVESGQPSYVRGGQGLAAPAKFYGIAISGMVNGTATVCISKGQPPLETAGVGMAYFSDGTWHAPLTVTKSGSSICGAISLSALQPSGEPPIVAIGNTAGIGTTGSGANLLVYAAPLLAALLVITILVLQRRGRTVSAQTETEDELEEEKW